MLTRIDAPLRVAVFGDTGNGNYGHQVDLGFTGRSDLSICAVTDPDNVGRCEAMTRLGTDHGYEDYRDLLASERPDIVAVAPRFPDRHCEMVTAALHAGCHVYCEKPLAVHLSEADQMVKVADERGLRLAVALPFTHEARHRQVWDLLNENVIGRVTHMKGFTKCDARAGGQDMAVLGPHLLDMLRRFAGDPVACSGRVYVNNRAAEITDVKHGDEHVGPIMGDDVCGLYFFENGVTGTVESVSVHNLGASHEPYRLEIYGEGGVLAVRAPYGDHGIWLSSEAPAPSGIRSWRRLPTAEVPSQRAYHALALDDFVEAIKQERQPAASGKDGLWALEMSHAIYTSHLAGETVKFPLQKRTHPLM